MPCLLIVHHTTSPSMQAMLEAVRLGAQEAAREVPLAVELRPALAASVVDVFGADGFVLGTPANIGYMSGALKHFFDTVYYPALEATRGWHYGLYVHGNNDTTGAVRGVAAIATGMGWRQARQPVSVIGTPTAGDLAQCRDLGGVCALAAAGAT